MKINSIYFNSIAKQIKWKIGCDNQLEMESN